MRKLFGLAVVVLALTGCTAMPTAANENSQSERGTAAEESAVAVPEETETPWPYTVREDGEEIFLSAMRNEGTFGLDDLSDSEFLAMGRDACEQMAAGASSDDVEVVDGDYPGEPSARFNDRSIGAIASETLCLEYDHFAGDR